MSKISDLLVMGHMAEENKDIRMSPHFVEAKITRGGGHITMGVDADTIHEIVLNPDKYLVALYVVNKDQFFAIKDSK